MIQFFWLSAVWTITLKVTKAESFCLTKLLFLLWSTTKQRKHFLNMLLLKFICTYVTVCSKSTNQKLQVITDNLNRLHDKFIPRIKPLIGEKWHTQYLLTGTVIAHCAMRSSTEKVNNQLWCHFLYYRNCYKGSESFCITEYDRYMDGLWVSTSTNKSKPQEDYLLLSVPVWGYLDSSFMSSNQQEILEDIFFNKKYEARALLSVTFSCFVLI